jgi:hypothetical protein
LRLSCKNHHVEPSHRRFLAFENASAAIKVQNVLLSAVLPEFLPLTLIFVTPMVMRMMPPWLETTQQVGSWSSESSCSRSRNCWVMTNHKRQQLLHIYADS